MSHGWLVRCDPTAGRFEVELGDGSARADRDGLTIATAGAHTPGEPAAEPGRSPAAAVATAVWSPAERTLRLVRDRPGRHPLFHARAGRVTLASPDLRRLLDEPGVSREPSAIAVAEWLLERPGPPEETLLAAIRRVPAGHVLRVDGHGASLSRDWAPPERGTHPPEDAARFGEVLEAAVAGALDGPAAVYLSGGIDSAAVSAATATASAGAGLPPPLALCADMPEESEIATQRLVSDTLRMPRVERTFAATPGVVGRALAIASAALWPVQSAWAAVGDDLLAAALADDRVTLLDGNGGDELLDAGLAPARGLLRRGQLRALLDLARAERGFSGAPAHSVLRAALGRGRPAPPDPLPDWVADPALRTALAERSATPPPADDLLDTFDAAGRETAVADALGRGYRVVQPYFAPEVVELLCGLPAAALVRGGEAKSPARAYLRERLPAVAGRWPRPGVVSDLLERLVPPLTDAETPHLTGLGLAGTPTTGASRLLAADVRWAMLSLEGWLHATSIGGE